MIDDTYRTAPLVLPEPKAIYNLGDTGNKFLTPSGGDPEPDAYRTTQLIYPEPKPLYNFGEQGNKYLTPSGQPDEKAYRTGPLVLAHPKTIYKPGDQGNKHLTPSGQLDQKNMVGKESAGWILLMIMIFSAIQELKLWSSES